MFDLFATMFITVNFPIVVAKVVQNHPPPAIFCRLLYDDAAEAGLCATAARDLVSRLLCRRGEIQLTSRRSLSAFGLTTEVILDLVLPGIENKEYQLVISGC
jgi:hypothetical protein